MVDIANDGASAQIFSQFLALLTEERVSQIISRQLLSSICKALGKMEHARSRPLCEVALQSLQQRAISFEEQGEGRR